LFAQSDRRATRPLRNEYCQGHTTHSRARFGNLAQHSWSSFQFVARHRASTGSRTRAIYFCTVSVTRLDCAAQGASTQFVHTIISFQPTILRNAYVRWFFDCRFALGAAGLTDLTAGVRGPMSSLIDSNKDYSGSSQQAPPITEQP